MQRECANLYTYSIVTNIGNEQFLTLPANSIKYRSIGPLLITLNITSSRDL
jgi:hypothetical protein